MKLSPKRLLRSFFHFLPRALRHRLLRRMMKLPSQQIPGLRVKIAHRKPELEQAFTLLHEAYVNAGFMVPNEAKLRVTKYHALPSTTTIVAMVGDEVVGTVSVVRDGMLGFPSDSLVDKTILRNTGARIAEVSSLAIAAKYRRLSHGAVLWPLLTHLLRYSQEYFGTDYFVIAVHPTHFDFYEGILFFKRITPKVIKAYGFVNNNPAMCGLLRLRDLHEQLKVHFGKEGPQRNLYNYMCQDPHEFLRFPKRENFKISDPFLTPELLDYFFRQRTSAFMDMKGSEVAILHSVYIKKEYRDVLPTCDEEFKSKFYQRQTVRFDVHCAGQIVLDGPRKVRLAVQNVSGGGFFAVLSEDVKFGEEVPVKISVAEFSVASLIGVPVWIGDGRKYGFRVLRADAHWVRFLQSLTADYDQQHSQSPFSILPQAI